MPSKRVLLRAAAAALAATTLALAAPAEAAGRAARKPAGFLRMPEVAEAVRAWLGVWLLPGGPGGEPASGLRNVSGAEGLGIDPDGHHLTGGTPAPPAPGSGETLSTGTGSTAGSGG
jgi:hypothetical protein